MTNKINKPTRLRSILARHVKELNPNADFSKIDALEEDIVTFVQGVLHGAEELGLEVKTSNQINNLD